jgi:predicted amidohydrolase YtcJ
VSLRIFRKYNIKGSLSTRKNADFIVLNKNPFKLDNIFTIEANETWINEELKYKK